MLTKKGGQRSISTQLTKKTPKVDLQDHTSALLGKASSLLEKHGHSIIDKATEHIATKVSPEMAKSLNTALKGHVTTLASSTTDALKQHADNAIKSKSITDFKTKALGTLTDHANTLVEKATAHVAEKVNPEAAESLKTVLKGHVETLNTKVKDNLKISQTPAESSTSTATLNLEEGTVSPNIPAPVSSSGPVLAPAAPVTDVDRIAKAKEVIDIVNSTKLPDPTIVNPESKFVIATYWWGRGNINRNVEHPCAAYEKEEKTEIEGYDYIKTIADPAEKAAEVEAEMESIRTTKIDNVSKDLGISKEEAKDRLYRKTPALKFEEMISRFEEDCKKANCNFLTQEYPFGRPLYQAAINGKPAFIKKALEACKGKGPNGSDLAVVYIDGDMRANVYPKIFDMDGMDFMARGWNIDPRANRKYLTGEICFDPYTFETSGGIQYFANTPASLDLLETWTLSNVANPGKADDRVISLAFNIFKYQLPLSYIQLPIEYLWLTDNYLFQKPDNTSVEKSIIEHPECLTGEDVAAESGAAANRSPQYYDSLVEANCECIVDAECDRIGRKIYEFVIFPTKDLVSTIGPYLEYLSALKNKEGAKMFDVIPFDNKYGKRQATADKNIAQSEKETEMPTDFDIPKILAQLKKGTDVTIGTSPKLEELKKEPLEFIATNLTGRVAGDEIYPDLKPKFDTTKPMFFSAKNPVLYHVLAMSDNGNDFSKVFNESFMFLERIRCYWL
jgi:hypothetical protein